jgi:hypothetical protein
MLQKEDHTLGLMNVAFKKDMPHVACQAGKQVEAPDPAKNIMITKDILKCYIWICLILSAILVLTVTNMVLLLLMIILVLLGCSFCNIKVKHTMC